METWLPAAASAACIVRQPLELRIQILAGVVQLLKVTLADARDQSA